MPVIRPARFTGEPDDADLCRTLMREYAHFLNESVGGEHICVASLEEELAGLPGSYVEPAGAILLAFEGDTPAGCVALKPLKLTLPSRPNERACEMKRLWVRPTQQGTGLGRKLGEAIMASARRRGYTAMYLDTMPQSMPAAYRLYCSMGFTAVDRYNQNPVLRQSDALQIAFLRREL
ncbi:MAG TPA: GNAT family N-acetyltransferase [Acidobacteriaceae bacterium]|jgi:GNAT superfamily N-acetyltransferase|nr:GNAT family N-acetyltransferase [Acidobacteriaceae bacterium]